jgi:hypothetical protein
MATPSDSGRQVIQQYHADVPWSGVRGHADTVRTLERQAGWLGSSSWDHLEEHPAVRAERPLKVSRQRSRNSISGQRGIDRSRGGLASPGQSLCGRQQFERRWLGPAGRDALPTNGSAGRQRRFSGRDEAGSTLSVEARRGGRPISPRPWRLPSPRAHGDALWLCGHSP